MKTSRAAIRYAKALILESVENNSSRAFTNSCPHQGVTTKWSYNSSQDKFKCSEHNNSFPTDCTTKGSAGSSPLKCFTSSFSGGKLTVTKS